MNQQEFLQSLEAFLQEWHNDEPTVWVHTSGSTGTPKPMQVEKERMMASARLTCSFLGLKEGDSALLCMPLQYIAGKMVVVRSLIANLKLIPVTPCGHPLKDLKEAPTFAAMIPMQVYNSLQVPEERALLKEIKQLIIGGGAIDDQLANELKDFPNAVWSRPVITPVNAPAPKAIRILAHAGTPAASSTAQTQAPVQMEPSTVRSAISRIL